MSQNFHLNSSFVSLTQHPPPNIISEFVDDFYVNCLQYTMANNNGKNAGYNYKSIFFSTLMFLNIYFHIQINWQKASIESSLQQFKQSSTPTNKRINVINSIRVSKLLLHSHIPKLWVCHLQ